MGGVCSGPRVEWLCLLCSVILSVWLSLCLSDRAYGAPTIQGDQVCAITAHLYPSQPGASLRTDFANIVSSRGSHNPANTRHILTGLAAVYT